MKTLIRRRLKELIRRKELRTPRLAVSAVAVAAVVAGAAGVAAAPGSAAGAAKAHAAHPSKDPKFKRPKLKHGLLSIEGTDESDAITLRLQAGDPGVLQVDVGDDGSSDFSFDRTKIAAIAVDAGSGNDAVASTRATASSPTRSRRPSTVATGTTTCREAQAPNCCLVATGTTRSTGTAAAISRSWARATTRSSGIPATGATS